MSPTTPRITTTVIRQARLVPVGTPVPTDGPVDIQITGGVITDVAPALRPRPGDLVVDAAGRWAIPGLWDQHVHFGIWSQSRAKIDVSGTNSAPEVTAIIAAHIAQLPPGPSDTVVSGFGFRSATWPQQPTVADMDAVSGAHPVILTSGDGHNGWLNSRALQLLGVPPRTGPLNETDWFAINPAVAALTANNAIDYEAALRTAVAAAAAKGVVGVVDFELAPGYLDWPDRFSRGIDQLKVRPATYPDRFDDVIGAGLRTGTPLLEDCELLTMGPLKIISDGSLNTRTAHCCEPYADAAQLEFPRGRQNVNSDELVTLLEQARRNRFDVALHAIGDAAVDIALCAFEVTGATGGIEHAQLMRRTDITRMGRLGVRASVQPAHLWDDRDVAQHCWPDRVDRCFPLQSMLHAGTTVVLGSDAPVSALDPWLAMGAAVHRSGDDREPWNPIESLTIEQALAASTDGHHTIATGNPGDLVLLDNDPLTATASRSSSQPTSHSSADTAKRLQKMSVAATFVAGRPTYFSL